MRKSSGWAIEQRPHSSVPRHRLVAAIAVTALWPVPLRDRRPSSMRSVAAIPIFPQNEFGAGSRGALSCCRRAAADPTPKDKEET
jgi:hypothetical protein